MALQTLFEHNAPFYIDSLVREDDSEQQRIRVLRIHPGDFDDPIVCDLSTIRFDEKAKFSALSYVWGSATQLRGIQVNDKEDFWVTENAHAALRRLRWYFGGITIWIDAVCIKQADVKEVNAQVAIMGDVYSLAEQVVVWLGPCHGSPENSILEAKRCHMQKAHDDLTKYTLATIRPSARGDQGAREIEAARHLLVPAQDQTKVWWARCWTYHEAVNAADLRFMIGSHLFTLTALAKLCGATYSEQLFPPSFDQALKLDIPRYARTPYAISRVNAAQPSFLGLLLDTNSRHATNPVDRIYGVLPVHARIGKPMAGRVIQVDYSKPLEAVLTEVAAMLILDERDLAVVIEAWSFFNKSKTTRPSWIPPIMNTRQRPEDPNEPWVKPVCAYHTTPPRAAGDHVKEFEDVPSHLFQHPGLQVLCENVQIDSRAHTLRVKALLFDCIHIRGQGVGIDTQLRDDIVSAYNGSSFATRGQLFRNAAVLKLQYGGGSEIDSMSAWEDVQFGREFHSKQIDTSGSIFVTREGFLGVTSAHGVYEGDVIVVVFGCSRPVVLRSVEIGASDRAGGKHYMLVCDAWVPSINQGQLMQLYLAGEAYAKTITIV